MARDEEKPSANSHLYLPSYLPSSESSILKNSRGYFDFRDPPLDLYPDNPKTIPPKPTLRVKDLRGILTFLNFEGRVCVNPTYP